MKIKSQVKAGAQGYNHNEALRVRSTVKAGAQGYNHNEALKIRSSVKAGACCGGKHFPEVTINP